MTELPSFLYSPTEIFEIIKEQYRLSSPLDPIADETFEIKKETTFAELQDAYDLLAWQEWTTWLNKCYAIHIPRKEWRKIVTPVKKKTLWDVCVFLSHKARKEFVLPTEVDSNESLNSAVFLYLKNSLAKKGTDVSKLNPSTILSEYLDKEGNFAPLIEAVTLTGLKTFNQLTYGEAIYERRNKYRYDKFIHRTVVKRPLNTGDLITFNDLTNKILENKKLGS